ncbi:MAG: diaminopimelate epimerase [Deltaproteobacteria bacterium]|nr:diaminopimelate epimerase [Deltaproteobacteria bacterium]
MATAKKFPFVKMQAIGNDYVVLEALKGPIANPNHLAKRLCNRRTGVGADQMLILTKSRKADFGMKTFNADGSEAEMCGNGIRCLARYVREHGITVKKEMVFETLSGLKPIKILGKQIQVDMGEPLMKGKEIPVNLSGRIVNRPLKIDAKDFRITCLSVGNPHCVIFHEAIREFPVERYGSLLENYHLFPKRVNVSFVNILARNEVEARVWERGAGETLGCGSAACAIGVASVLNGFTDRSVVVVMPGGKVSVEWNAKDNHIYLTGPAEEVFRGELKL